MVRHVVTMEELWGSRASRTSEGAMSWASRLGWMWQPIDFTEAAGLDSMIRLCDRRSERHAWYAFLLGLALVVVVGVVLILLIVLILLGPLGEDVKTSAQTPAMWVLLPTLAIIAGFLASLSRFHLKLMTRWDDYALAFIRIKLSATTDGVDQKRALLGGVFAAVHSVPEVEVKPAEGDVGEVLGAVKDAVGL
jgi:hypothetical protein